MQFDEVANALELGDAHEPWRQTFARSEKHEASSVLDARTLDRRLDFIRMSDEPANALRHARQVYAESPALRRVLAHVHHGQFIDADTEQRCKSWPMLPESCGEAGALLYALACLEELPTMYGHYQRRGIPDQVAIDTMADLELWLREYHQKTGRWGLDMPQWLAHHLRAGIFALGRLQYQPGVIHTQPFTDLNGAPFRDDDAVIWIHIPASGKMTHEACGESLEMARAFFPRYFPETPFKAFICITWLLDDQLAHYLPADSNIVKFINRFHLMTMRKSSDAQTFERVFGGPIDDINQAPQDTSLRKIIVQHVKAGGKWKKGAGYIPIANDPG